MTDSFVLSASATLADIADDELVEFVEKLRKSNKILDMENSLFINFLNRVDPKMLQGLEAILEHASRIQGLLEHAHQSMNTDELRVRSKSVASVSSTHSFSKISQASNADRRINLTTKIDMLSKDRELYSSSLDEYYVQIKQKRDNMKAELEEINTRISETKEAREIFELTIVRDAVDPITQRIPAEKFLRYMEEWLKSADSIIEKLRLRSCTLKYRKIFLQNQLKQKEELGESLHPVDLDQLKIDNRVLNKKLEQKNIDLLDLKKKSGEANLLLSKTKRYLLSLTKSLNNMIHETEHKRKKVINLEKEISLVEEVVNISQEKLTTLENLNQKYTVPDLVDYIKQKSAIYSLKQNIKIWERRNNIQWSSLETCIKTMKRLTQSNVVDPSWFDSTPKKSEGYFYDDEDI